jgi:type I site-specific restriction-modification system R (restriction) subunit
LLLPDRLLELIYGYIIFDNGTKKIARYQQYFAVKATLDRVKQIRGDSSRQGGMIWHTTGSGKSLTMVMLAKALALERKTILNPKIILVNDRIDLDTQLKDTFKNCGAQVTQAKSGQDLLELVNNPKAEIITTIIDKFDTVAREKGQNPSADIFVLVDESHRSQYGQIHAKMRNVFPNGCYIGFTGTPLLKKEKSTAAKFGGLIHSYTMPKAVGGKAVVPILYEGRESEFKNTEAVDKWFDRITADLNEQQKADLKRKFKSAEPLYEFEARMAEVAYDISEHFVKHFKGTGLKGQFATSSKRAAINYKTLINGWGKVRSDVIISAPDTREDNDSVDEADISEVQRFWKDYGLVIDYRGIFGDMTDAMKLYDALEQEGFDRADIVGALVDVQTEIAKLSTHHAAVWDVFKGVSNLQDTESLQQWLYPQDRRDDFYESLRDFSKILQLALSNSKLQADTSESTKQRYSQDLKYFLNLRQSVKIRYAEAVDYSEYAEKIRTMVVREIGASEFTTIIEPINIFDVDRSDAEIAEIAGVVAQADAIAARVKKVAIEKMAEDPVLYLRLSQLIQTAIEAHRAKRLSDLEYLQQMREHLDTARTRGATTVPASLHNREQARAFYNVLQDKLANTINPDQPEVLVTLAIGIEEIITRLKVRDWQHNQDIQNRMLDAIDDLIHHLNKDQPSPIHWTDIDEIIAKIMNIARNHETN